MQDRDIRSKVKSEKGRYFIEVEGRREELRPEHFGGEEVIRELIDEDVEVLFSEPRRFVIGLLRPHKPPILCYLVGPGPHVETAARQPAALAPQVLCYILPRPTCYLPAPWMIRGVEKQVQANLADAMLKEGVISREVHGKLTK